MISLEQVQLLESRVSKAIEYVQKVKAENAALVSEKNTLQTKLEVTQKRIDELELLVMRFKEDQGRIEDGIIAALDRLSQFEEAFENSLKDKPPVKKPAVKTDNTEEVKAKEMFFEIKSSPEVNEAETNIKEGEDTTSSGELDIF